MASVPGAVAGVSSQAANIAALAGGPFALAMKDFTDVVTGATSGMEEFVKALSPVTLDLFNVAVEELMATIGQALLPVLDVFTSVVQRIADVISPLMQQLAPVLKQLAEIVGTVLIGAIDLLVGIFTAIGSVMGGTVNALSSFKQGLQEVVRWLIKGVAYLIKAFAGAEAVQKWADAVAGIGTRAIVPPKEVSIKGLADIASSMATSAFVASGAGEGEDDMLSLQRAIAEDLRDIAKNGKNFINEFLDKLVERTIRVAFGTKAESYYKGASLGLGILADQTAPGRWLTALNLRMGL